MTEERNEETSEEQGRRKKKPRERKQTQGQLIQESLGMSPSEIKDIEELLFIARFLDYYSEDTLDFVFKDKQLTQYIERITDKMGSLDEGREEDKLLKMTFEEKDVFGTIYNLKDNAEGMAKSKGISKSPEKQLKFYTLVITIPLFAVVAVMAFMPIDILFLFPLLCVFCMLPQLLRGFVTRKWSKFKAEYKDEVYALNRDDILLLKSLVGEILANIRGKLLELQVPLDLIKFTLHSRDYENLKLINERQQKGVTFYYYVFDYPDGMVPIPVPEKLQEFQQASAPAPKAEPTLERNFIILSELKAKDGVLNSFVPALKEDLAEKINQLLNEAEITKTTRTLQEIIPSYPEPSIYCVCGEVADIAVSHICTWNEEFKFYLFEAEKCNCNEEIYIVSLMDEDTEVPEEFKEIFSS